MTKVSNSFEWDEMCQFTDEDLNNLLTFYSDDKVPSFDDLKAMRRDSKSDVFDGSFGFSVGA